MTYSNDPKSHPFEEEQSVRLVGPGAPYMPRLDYCRWCGKHRDAHVTEPGPAALVESNVLEGGTADVLTRDRATGGWTTTGSLREAARIAAQELRWQAAGELYDLAADRYPAASLGGALGQADVKALRELAATCKRTAARLVAEPGESEPPHYCPTCDFKAGSAEELAAHVAALEPTADDLAEMHGEPYDGAAELQEAIDLKQAEDAAEAWAGDILADPPFYPFWHPDLPEVALARGTRNPARTVVCALLLLLFLLPALAHAAPAKPKAHPRPACQEIADPRRPGSTVWARPTKSGWSDIPCETTLTLRETSRIGHRIHAGLLSSHQPAAQELVGVQVAHRQPGLAARLRGLVDGQHLDPAGGRDGSRRRSPHQAVGRLLLCAVLGEA